MSTATAEAPNIVAAPPTKVPSGQVPVAGGGEIHVKPPTDSSPLIKPGPAMERMRADLQKRAKPSSLPGEGRKQEATPPAKPAVTPEPPATPPVEQEVTPPETPPETPAAEAAPKEGEAPAVTDKTKTKVNPWKLVDEHKTARTKLEKEVADLRKLIPNEEQRKQEMAEIEQIRNRAKELEDEIRYVNYAKSPEFKEKYEKPYQVAWAKAMADLKEITVEDPTSGEQRAVVANDILELVNAPLGKAREMANALFGDFADDVMAHRKEIKNLFEAQASALEEAREKGAEREKQQVEMTTKKQAEISKFIADEWAKWNEAAIKDETHGKLFTPQEGDDEGNTRLAKGYELVDRAFKESPMNPNLTPEQRSEVIRRHAAVRNRAAAYGRLVYQKSQLEAKLNEALKKLEQFEGSQPNIAGGQQPKPEAVEVGARAQVFGALRKLAK